MPQSTPMGLGGTPIWSHGIVPWDHSYGSWQGLIRNILIVDKVIVNKKKQKYNFIKDNFLRVIFLI